MAKTPVSDAVVDLPPHKHNYQAAINPLDSTVAIVSMIVLQLISGLASPWIFLPGLAIGWFVRRWWQVVLGAVTLTVLTDLEVMLMEMPGAEPDWSSAPIELIAPLVWCASGYLLRGWHQRAARRRPSWPIRSLPVVAGMVLGAVILSALALAVGLLYLQAGQLEYHTFQFGEASGADYETIFFQYLFPGLLLGQIAGGLIGRVFGRPLAAPLGAGVGMASGTGAP